VAGAVVPPALTQAGVEVGLGGGEADVLWEKLARQAPLAVLTAVTGRPAGEVRADPRLRAAVEEACAVAAADGAATTFAKQWSIIESLPADLITSTARDIAAGLPSELDAIGGAVVRAGHCHGVPTPTLQELIALLEGFNVDDEADWERAEALVASGEATLTEIERPPYPYPALP
jgi:2-dehydropantoate 2-reductase